MEHILQEPPVSFVNKKCHSIFTLKIILRRRGGGNRSAWFSRMTERNLLEWLTSTYREEGNQGKQPSKPPFSR